MSIVRRLVRLVMPPCANQTIRCYMLGENGRFIGHYINEGRHIQVMFITNVHGEEIPPGAYETTLSELSRPGRLRYVKGVPVGWRKADGPVVAIDLTVAEVERTTQIQASQIRTPLKCFRPLVIDTETLLPVSRPPESGELTLEPAICALLAELIERLPNLEEAQLQIGYSPKTHNRPPLWSACLPSTFLVEAPLNKYR